MAQDQIQDDTLPLTHEFVSLMLAVRRKRPGAAALLGSRVVAKGATLGLALRSRRDGWEGSRDRAPTAVEQGREVADR